MKKIFAILVLCMTLLTGCESNIGAELSTNMYYDKAIVKLSDGKIVEGKLESWNGGSNAIDVKINGVVYCVAYVNCTLIRTES